jgi:hypothetical protein
MLVYEALSYCGGGKACGIGAGRKPLAMHVGVHASRLDSLHARSQRGLGHACLKASCTTSLRPKQ